MPPTELAISEPRGHGWDPLTHQDVQHGCALCRHWWGSGGISLADGRWTEGDRDGRAVTVGRADGFESALTEAASDGHGLGISSSWRVMAFPPMVFSKDMARFFTSILSSELITPVPFLILIPQPPSSTSLTVSDNGAQQWTVPSRPPPPPPPPSPHTAFRCPPVPVHGCTQLSPSCSPSLPSNSPSTDTKNAICPVPRGLSRLSANSRIRSSRPWRGTCVSGMPVT